MMLCEIGFRSSFYDKSGGKFEFLKIGPVIRLIL